MSAMITKAGAAASIERSSQISQTSCGDGDALGDCHDWSQPASDATQHWHDVQTIAKELAGEWKLQQKLRASPAGPVVTSRGARRTRARSAALLGSVALSSGAASAPAGTTPDLSTVFFDWDKSVKLEAGDFHNMAEAASW